MNQYAFQYCPKLVIISEDKTKVLLCQRRGEADYDGTFSFIGGKLEVSDATLLQGIKREKTEEIGAEAKVKVVADYSVNVLFSKKDGSQMVVPHHYAEYAGGKIKLNSDEYSDYQWVDIRELAGFEPKIANIPTIVNALLRLIPMLKDTDFALI